MYQRLTIDKQSTLWEAASPASGAFLFRPVVIHIMVSNVEPTRYIRRYKKSTYPPSAPCIHHNTISLFVMVSPSLTQIASMEIKT